MHNQFIGHSGCKLQLIDKAENMIVRKTSHHHDYNQRLHNQFIKQSTVALRKFSQTRVYESGHTPEGLFYFDMEFIPGPSLAQSFHGLHLTQLQDLSDIFSGLYVTETSFYPQDVFIGKIHDITSKLQATHSGLKPCILTLNNYQWNIEKSPVCHGDLGLENIILFNNELYIIDLLDSFSNSWVIDIAKILQDVEAHWAFRSQFMTRELESNLNQFKTLLFQKLLKKGLTFKQYSDCYYLLMLNLFRILPYSKNEQTDNFLILAIHDIHSKIATLEIDYEYLNRTLRG